MSIQRIQINGTRHYVDTESLELGISVTEFLGRVFPVSPHLKDWWIDNSRESVENTLSESSDFGTRFHDYAERIAGGEVLDISKMDNKMAHYITSLQHLFWDRNVEPLAIESFVFHKESDQYPLSFGGTLDIECMIDWNGGRVRALMDYKTGKIHKKHKFQLMAYMAARQQQDPDLEFHLFNFSPNNWRSSPTSKPKHWKVTEKDLQTFRSLCILYKNEIWNLPKSIREFDDVAIGSEPKYRQIPLNDYIKQKIEEQDEEI